MGFEISLKGKNAVVTGGARGMGRAISMLLAEAGANVLVSDMNEEAAAATAAEIAEKYGVKTISCKCNVIVKEEVDAMVELAIKTFGRIDILNHIAGASIKVDFLEMSEEVYDMMMDVNAKGTFLVDQAVLKAMIAQEDHEGCKIVNMSSQSGKFGFPTNIAYTASKFAVTGLTQAIAQYAAPYRINVNAVCPGIVRTAIWERMLDDVRQAGGDPEEYWNMRMEGIPLKRPQTMDDIAHMFLYLSSDLANNMTGQGINVTGGRIMQ